MSSGDENGFTRRESGEPTLPSPTKKKPDLNVRVKNLLDSDLMAYHQYNAPDDSCAQV